MYRKIISKKSKQKSKRYQNPDGSFKEMTCPDDPSNKSKFCGCVRYFMSEEGGNLSLERAKKMCGYIKRRKYGSEEYDLQGDVIKLETPDEDFFSDVLDRICVLVDRGTPVEKRRARRLLSYIWDGEDWLSIKDKLDEEGFWYVWWMDGVHSLMTKLSQGDTKVVSLLGKLNIFKTEEQVPENLEDLEKITECVKVWRGFPLYNVLWNLSKEQKDKLLRKGITIDYSKSDYIEVCPPYDMYKESAKYGSEDYNISNLERICKELNKIIKETGNPIKYEGYSIIRFYPEETAQFGLDVYGVLENGKKLNLGSEILNIYREVLGDKPTSFERTNIKKSSLRKMSLSNKGYTFKEAQRKARTLSDDIRWVYGNRHGLWYPITKEDRDYDIWGIPNEEFMRMSEQEALATQDIRIWKNTIVDDSVSSILRKKSVEKYPRRFGKPRTDKERLERHRRLHPEDEVETIEDLPPRGTGLRRKADKDLIQMLEEMLDEVDDYINRGDFVLAQEVLENIKWETNVRKNEIPPKILKQLVEAVRNRESKLEAKRVSKNSFRYLVMYFDDKEGKWNEITRDKMLKALSDNYDNAEELVSMLEKGELPTVTTSFAAYKVQPIINKESSNKIYDRRGKEINETDVWAEDDNGRLVRIVKLNKDGSVNAELPNGEIYTYRYPGDQLKLVSSGSIVWDKDSEKVDTKRSSYKRLSKRYHPPTIEELKPEPKKQVDTFLEWAGYPKKGSDVTDLLIDYFWEYSVVKENRKPMIKELKRRGFKVREKDIETKGSLFQKFAWEIKRKNLSEEEHEKRIKKIKEYEKKHKRTLTQEEAEKMYYELGRS